MYILYFPNYLFMEFCSEFQTVLDVENTKRSPDSPEGNLFAAMGQATPAISCRPLTLVIAT